MMQLSCPSGTKRYNNYVTSRTEIQTFIYTLFYDSKYLSAEFCVML